jgi:hypothetical protein
MNFEWFSGNETTSDLVTQLELGNEKEKYEVVTDSAIDGTVPDPVVYRLYRGKR